MISIILTLVQLRAVVSLIPRYLSTTSTVLPKLALKNLHVLLILFLASILTTISRLSIFRQRLYTRQF